MVSSTVISYMLQDVFRKVVQGTTKILHNRSESGSAGHVIQPLCDAQYKVTCQALPLSLSLCKILVIPVHNYNVQLAGMYPGFA